MRNKYTDIVGSRDSCCEKRDINTEWDKVRKHPVGIDWNQIPKIPIHMCICMYMCIGDAKTPHSNEYM